jgi:3-dehydroquinate dehydratase II
MSGISFDSVAGPLLGSMEGDDSHKWNLIQLLNPVLKMPTLPIVEPPTDLQPSMTRTIHILNGPNLNRLGVREPAIYGSETLASIQRRCETRALTHGLSIVFRQTNTEGVLVEHIHEACDQGAAGIVINPAGYSFTSVALVDALKMFEGPKIEVHLSNIHARDAMYHHSLVSRFATAVIAGLGAEGYLVAVDAVAARLPETGAGQ